MQFFSKNDISRLKQYWAVKENPWKYEEELWKKVFSTTPNIDFIRPVEDSFRDRIDATIQHDAIAASTQDDLEYQKIGFYKKDSRDILDIEFCPLMSQRASDFYIQKIHCLQ